MSFSPVGPFAFGDKLSSAAMNQLDADHVNSLDRSVAGDSIFGRVILDASGGLLWAVAQGQIQGRHAGAIEATVASGITSGAVGGIQLNAGSTDWVTFSATRSRTIVVGLNDAPQVVGTSLIQASTNGTSNQTSSLSGPTGFWIPITQRVHNQATLSTVVVSFSVGQSHSGVPANMPQFFVERMNASGSIVELSSTAQQVATPATGAAWFDSGAVQTFTCTCDQNNVIDTSQYAYLFRVSDESGANALNQNLWISIALGFTGIGSLQFP
jgi:hypothetical protein